jgi:hypothetical protein
MEITISNAQNLPPNPHISIRSHATGTRRQALYHQNDTYKFPLPQGDDPITVTFDIFSHLTSTEIKVDTNNKDKQKLDFVNPRSGEQLSLDFIVETPGVNQQDPQPRSAQHDIAREYLTTHKIQTTIQKLTQALLTQKPEEPLKFMASYFESLCSIPDQCDTLPSSGFLDQSRRSYALDPLRSTSVETDPTSAGTPQTQHYPISPIDGLPDYRADGDAPKSLGAFDEEEIVNVCRLSTKKNYPWTVGKYAEIGLVAGDAESYELYAPVFNGLIDELPSLVLQTPLESSFNVDELLTTNTGNRVTDLEIRMCRSFHGLRFPNCMQEAERIEVEEMALNALFSLEGHLRGDYFPLQGSTSYSPKPDGITQEELDHLRKANLIFEAPGPSALCGGFARDWPNARGIYINKAETFFVGINGDDHMEIISKYPGPDLRKGMSESLESLQTLIGACPRLAHSPTLGYLTSHPSDLGIHITVSMRLPLLAQSKELPMIAESLEFVWKVTNTGIEISNKICLGPSETQIMNTLLLACGKLTEFESYLENGIDLNDYLGTRF